MTKRKDSETFFYFLIFFLVVTIIVISIYGVSKVFNKLSGTDKEVMIEIAEQNCNELDAELTRMSDAGFYYCVNKYGEIYMQFTEQEFDRG